MYYALYVFTLSFIKLFSHLLGMIGEYSLWIIPYTNIYKIFIEYNIAMIRSKGGYSDVKGIVREFFNVTGNCAMPKFICTLTKFICSLTNES